MDICCWFKIYATEQHLKLLKLDFQADIEIKPSAGHSSVKEVSGFWLVEFML